MCTCPYHLAPRVYLEISQISRLCLVYLENFQVITSRRKIMKLSKNRVYSLRAFEHGQIANAVRSVLDTAGDDNARVSLGETSTRGDRATRKIDFSELEAICHLENRSIVWVNDNHAFCLREQSGYLVLELEAPDATTLDRFRAAFEENLQLELAELPDRSEQLLNLDKRLAAIERYVYAPHRTLRCFLSYRFNDVNELTALRVTQFLRLLEVDVLTGATYEPKQVSDKVLSKLQEPLDFLVLLITGDGESTWTRDEISTALHKGLALVPLVENGASFEPGLFADVEYIQFDTGHIGDAFLKLLEAVSFIRRQTLTASSESESV